MSVFIIAEIDNEGFKVYDAAGNLIDPAKEGGNLADIKTVLTAIRDSAGIKKIVDALPAGTNEIGKVAQGTKAAAADAWPLYLVDNAGNLLAVDAYTKTQGTIELPHLKVHLGKHFTCKNWQEVSGSGSELNLLLKVPQGTYPHLTAMFGTGDAFVLDLYEGTTVSADGTAETIFNNNRGSTTTPGVGLYRGPTITNVGTKLLTEQVGRGRDGAASDSVSSRECELILKTNTNYLVRFTKSYGNAAMVDYQFSWYES